MITPQTDNNHQIPQIIYRKAPDNICFIVTSCLNVFYFTFSFYWSLSESIIQALIKILLAYLIIHNSFGIYCSQNWKKISTLKCYKLSCLLIGISYSAAIVWSLGALYYYCFQMPSSSSNSIIIFLICTLIAGAATQIAICFFQYKYIKSVLQFVLFDPIRQVDTQRDNDNVRQNGQDEESFEFKATKNQNKGVTNNSQQQLLDNQELSWIPDNQGNNHQKLSF